MTEAKPESSVHQAIMAVAKSVSQVIVGKQHIIEQILVALLARGHVLIEDVPGVGKTSLVRAVASASGLGFCRIQFTPDLMPSDVTGVSIYDSSLGCFRFQPGPVFTQVLLADEVNRTSPKTQSSLLEAMEERHVSVDGNTYPLPVPFFVLATQNPVEYEGTFPLPESQLDRFLFKVALGYPSPVEESEILEKHSSTIRIADLAPVASASDIIAAQGLAAQVRLSPLVRDYIVSLCQRTRQHPDVYLGAGPRGSLALSRATRALAYLRGRAYVIPDDVKELLHPALAHRLIMKAEARLIGVSARNVLDEVLEAVRVPVA